MFIFKACLKQLKTPKNIVNISKCIKKKNYERYFSYVYVALRMFLHTPASNCSMKRSFSTLWRVKTYLNDHVIKKIEQFSHIKNKVIYNQNDLL
jgi:hypothetical protein